MSSFANVSAQSPEADTVSVSTAEVLHHFDALHPVYRAKSAKARKSSQASDRDPTDVQLAKAARFEDQLDIEVTYAQYQATAKAPGQPDRAEDVALCFAQLELELRTVYAASFSADAFRKYVAAPVVLTRAPKGDVAALENIKPQHPDLAAALESKAVFARQKAKANARTRGDAAPRNEPQEDSDSLDPPFGVATPVVQSRNPDWAASVMRHYDHIAGRPGIMPSCKGRAAMEKLRGLDNTAFANAVVTADMKATLKKLEPGLTNDVFREQMALQTIEGGMAGFEEWTWSRDRVTDATLIRAMEAWRQGRNKAVERLCRQWG
ncbi:hypothetical protein B0A48_07991 [Cryoendolithus antarcticus]|uniref:Uncharacterized protein n=1 Tax=Cryoendolithus antarcticus TaxID=1507870 RepID=A0A1V8T0N2_9PEZI|nr:hypothetical protein B0A48_07991 [Cryoendolithus antarcticus]